MEGKSFNEFITALKSFAVDCEFQSLKDSLIREQIIRGKPIQDNSLKERLLKEENLDLNKCIKICEGNELTDIQLQKMCEILVSKL